jgi:nitroreductase
MTFIELITKRRSVRDYKCDPVPEEMLFQILEAGRLAPTGANRQPITTPFGNAILTVNKLQISMQAL